MGIPPSTLEPFLDGLREGRLSYQHCIACGQAQTLTRYVCVRCGDSRLTWRSASGRGRVFAHTQVTRAPSEIFRSLVPYTIVVVELDEGCRVMGHAASPVEIGEAVQVRSTCTADGFPLLLFERILISE